MAKRITFILALVFCGVWAPTFAEIRSIEPSTLERVVSKFTQGPVVLMMRHGAQQPSGWVEALPSPAMQKIAMMRGDENRKNPLTQDSARELSATVQVLREVFVNSPLEWQIETSGNVRACQAAAILADGGRLAWSIESRWNCVDYPSEQELATEDLLSLLPSGSMPWEEETVDKVLGSGTFGSIHQQVAEALLEVGPGEGRIIVTHTQQINAVCEQYGLPVRRVGNYGFVLITPEGAELFPSGLYPMEGA